MGFDGDGNDVALDGVKVETSISYINIYGSLLVVKC